MERALINLEKRIAISVPKRQNNFDINVSYEYTSSYVCIYFHHFKKLTMETKAVSAYSMQACAYWGREFTGQAF